MGEYILAILFPFIAAFINKKWALGILMLIACTISLVMFWQIWVTCSVIACLIVYTERRKYTKWEKFKAELNMDEKRTVDNTWN